MLLTFVIFCVCLLALLVALLAYLYKGVKNPTTVPGLEPSDPKTGNIGDIGKAGGFELFLDKLHAEFGAVASFWYGEEYMVSVGRGAELKPLNAIFDRPASLFQMVVPLASKNSLQFANGSEGKGRWRAYSEALSPHNNGRKLTDLVSICREMARVLEDKPAGEHVPLTSCMTGLAIKMLSKAQLGSYFQDDDKVQTFYRQYESMNHTMVEILVSGATEAKEEKWAKDIKEMHATLQGALDAYRAARESGDYEESPLLNAIVESCTDDEVENDDVIGKTLADVITMVIGGYHTTAYALIWIFHLLTHHQDVQDKVHAEVARVAGELLDGDCDDQLAIMSKLVYTRQVIDETLRLVRLAGFAARVATDHEVRVGGHLLPPGTPVIAALHVINHDPQVFPEPDRFDPDRFSAENSRGRGQLGAPAFGFGARRCPGYNWAYAEIMVAMTIVLSKFKLHPITQKDEVKQAHGFVTKPDRDIWITLEKRRNE